MSFTRFLITTTFFLIICVGFSLGENDTNKPYLDIKEGSYWQYDVEISTPEKHPLQKTVLTESERKNGNIHYKTIEDRISLGNKIINGVKEPVTAIMVYLDEMAFKKECQYLQISDKKVVGVGSSITDSYGKTHHLIFDNPITIAFEDASPGLEWVWETKTINFSFRVLKEEKITVPAGEFDCLCIQAIQKNAGEIISKRTYWYADKIGIIKEMDENYIIKGLYVKKQALLKKYSLSPEKK